jgi:hypothetical protein
LSGLASLEVADLVALDDELPRRPHLAVGRVTVSPTSSEVAITSASRHGRLIVPHPNPAG